MLSLTLFGLWRKGCVSLVDMFVNNSASLIRFQSSEVFYRICLVRVPGGNLGVCH